MKVKRFEECSIMVTVFDDGVRWVHTERRTQGQPARTIAQRRADQQLTKEDLLECVNALWGIVETMVNQTLKEQQQIFAHDMSQLGPID